MALLETDPEELVQFLDVPATLPDLSLVKGHLFLQRTDAVLFEVLDFCLLLAELGVLSLQATQLLIETVFLVLTDGGVAEPGAGVRVFGGGCGGAEGELALLGSHPHALQVVHVYSLQRLGGVGAAALHLLYSIITTEPPSTYPHSPPPVHTVLYLMEEALASIDNYPLQTILREDDHLHRRSAYF